MKATTRALIHLTTVGVIIGAPLLLILGVGHSLEASAASLGLANASSDYAIGLLWALIILSSIPLWPVPLKHRLILMLLWGARIGLTLGFMLLYEGHYGLDAGFYFAEGALTDDPLSLFAFGRGNDNVIALVTLFIRTVPASYHATKVTFSLLGLLAVYLIYRASCLYSRRENIPLFYVLGLFPSIMFWGSILGKDPVTLLGIAAFTFGVVGFSTTQSWRYLTWGVLGISLAAFMRVWLGMIFLPPLGVLLIFRNIGIIRKIILMALVTGGGLLSVAESGNQLSIEDRNDALSSVNQYSQAFSEGASGQRIEGGITDETSFVAFMPVGVFAALFRPLPGEVMNLFGILAGIENTLLLWLTWRALRSGNLRRLTEPLIVWGFTTIIVWAGTYGVIAYQNFGTGFRFKVQVMPLLLVLLLYLGQRFAFSPRVGR